MEKSKTFIKKCGKGFGGLEMKERKCSYTNEKLKSPGAWD